MNLPRFLPLLALSLTAALALAATIACGTADEGGDAGDAGPTVELAAPPASLVATVAPSPTSTPMPTATAEDVVEATVVMVERAKVNIPNRGYNALGDPEAPITMFDFSDFL